MPNDTSWCQAVGHARPFEGIYGINLPGAWDITLGSPSITVGVIDTGYRPHVDLAGRFVAGYDFIGDALVANDGNGRDSDALDPGDWITSAENASGYFQGCGARNSSWHGTHVSGTIGAVAEQRHRRRRDQPGLEDPAAAGARQVRRLHERHRRRDPLVRRPARHAASPTTTRRRTGVVNISLGGSGAVRLDDAERDQRRRRSGHGRRRRRREQQRERGELHPRELRQRDHGRRDRPHGQAARTTRTTARRSRSRRRAATRSSARRSSRRSTPARRRPAPTRTRTTRARAWRRRTSSASSR